MSPHTPARLTYGHGEFFVEIPGDFVTCAVTGVEIPLDELKYWDVELQEAYASPTAALKKKQQQGHL